MKVEANQAVQKVLNSTDENREWYTEYMKHNAPRIAADANFIIKHTDKNSKVLDVGGVPPLFLEYLLRGDFKDLSIADPHPEPFSQYFESEDIHYHKANVLADLPENMKEQFDVVCMNEVVEHLAGNLLSAINNVSSCVKPGGMLMITTPNLRSIWGFLSIFGTGSGLASKPLDTVREQFERDGSEFGYFGHVREYTPKEIIDLIESFGYKLYKSEFQVDYRTPNKPLLRLVSHAIHFFEYICPPSRLFGKYLFIKK